MLGACIDCTKRNTAGVGEVNVALPRCRSIQVDGSRITDSDLAIRSRGKVGIAASLRNIRGNRIVCSANRAACREGK